MRIDISLEAEIISFVKLEEILFRYARSDFQSGGLTCEDLNM